MCRRRQEGLTTPVSVLQVNSGWNHDMGNDQSAQVEKHKVTSLLSHLQKLVICRGEVQIPRIDFALHPLCKLTRKRGRARLSPLWLRLHSVTLTHFSKMQPPVEPSRLPAKPQLQWEAGGKRKSGRMGGGREGERGRGRHKPWLRAVLATFWENMMCNRWRRGELHLFVIFSALQELIRQTDLLYC